MRDNGSRCKMTVDGTDYRIPEQHPFNPKWFSKKFNGPGVRYEVGVCIQTGWVCWMNGPFPCGAWPDLRISRESLIYRLPTGEKVVADKGYRGSHWHMVPDNNPITRNPVLERMMAIARSRHETVNRKFKEFGCLQNRWRHPLRKHYITTRACYNLVQLSIRKRHSTFQVEYNDRVY